MVVGESDRAGGLAPAFAIGVEAKGEIDCDRGGDTTAGTRASKGGDGDTLGLMLSGLSLCTRGAHVTVAGCCAAAARTEGGAVAIGLTSAIVASSSPYKSYPRALGS